MLHICCLFVYHLYIVYLVSDDPNIDSQQVVYISLIFFLKRMTNHFKIQNVLSWNILECLEISSFFPKSSLPCQKNFVESYGT